MEREGWDFENERFIDFNDNDENNFLNRTKHTHIDQDQDPRSIAEDVDLTEQSRSEPSKSEHNPVNNENSNNEAPIEAAAIPEQAQFIKVRTPTNEEVFTYAFCKLFANLHEVNYEQIEQLALPFFKVKEARAIKNKPNILIANQCVVRKANDKKWFKILPGGVQRFKNENQHIEEFLEKRVSMDFLDALTP